MEIISTLTELENKALDCLCRQLAIWREDEPGYSCIDGADITRELGWPARTTSGVIGSLCKKGFIESDDNDDFDGLLYVRWEKIPNEFGRCNA